MSMQACFQLKNEYEKKKELATRISSNDQPLNKF